MTEMTTETTMATEPGQDTTVEEKISQLRELFADAPEVGKTALEKVLSRLWPNGRCRCGPTRQTWTPGRRWAPATSASTRLCRSGPVVPAGALGELRLDAKKSDIIPEFPY
jgi:hypothetical protein